MNICPETTSHPVNTGVDLMVAYPKSKGQAEIHKAGCSHTKRVTAYQGEPVPFTGSLADDWFDVAPCARARARKS